MGKPEQFGEDVRRAYEFVRGTFEAVGGPMPDEDALVRAARTIAKHMSAVNGPQAARSEGSGA